MKSDPFRAPNTSQTKLSSACDAHSRNQPSADSRFSIAAAIAAPDDGAHDDSILLALGVQFEEIAGQLDNLQIISSSENPEQIEALLARLDPIERSIMATPARTIAGLGVKASHASYVLSQYWEEPVDQIDWDAKAVRLLIEAVCEVARMPLPFKLGADEWSRRAHASEAAEKERSE
jgi:hypothetical protein